jgi:N-acyl-D-aspartate/D-glutamate deacylase
MFAPARRHARTSMPARARTTFERETLASELPAVRLLSILREAVRAFDGIRGERWHSRDELKYQYATQSLASCDRMNSHARRAQKESDKSQALGWGVLGAVRVRTPLGQGDLGGAMTRGRQRWRVAWPADRCRGKLARSATRGLLSVLATCSVFSADARTSADFIIRNGTIYSGADEPEYRGDVVITGDRIAYVGPSSGSRFDARSEIDATGKIVAPGFIDVHTHPETYIRSADPHERLNAPWLFQGVSTVFIGVDGSGTPDVGADAAQFERQGVGTNLVMYVGFGAVRERVLHEDARAPDATQLKQMRALVARGMCEGAIGFSTGLFYPPQSFADTEEVISLAREAATRGGIYDTHQRDESSYSIGLMNSVQEAIRIGREAGMPVHVAHIKALGVDVQGRAPDVIAAIAAAREVGQDVTADQYPWTASGSSLDAALLPRWAVDGGRPALLKRLDDPVPLARIRVEMQENLRRRGGADSLLLTSTGLPWTGKTLAQMAKTWNTDPVDAAVRIIRATESEGAAVASFNMLESDIRLFMQQPWVVTSSDGSDGHPRQYATFPMKYAKYARDEKVITVREFIRSSSGRSADMFKLDHRGYLKAGFFADVVVLDPARYAPKADYVHPRVLSEGVEQLWVNGRLAIGQGKITAEAGGRVLLHNPPPGSCQR